MTVSLLAGALVIARTVPVLAEQPKAAATKQSGMTEPDVTELMRTALARYKQNDLEGARQAFQKAWELRQHAAVAASLADVELKLGRYREAAGHLNFYLANLPPGKETMRTDAEQQLAECKKHLGSVKVEVDPADAMVLVDGSAIGEGPQELLVEPGAHSLQATVSGRLSPKESFTIAPGESRQARLIVAPATAAAAAQQPGPAQPPPQTSAPSNPPPVQDTASTKFWVALGGGAGAAVGIALGVAFTLKSNSKSDHANEVLRQIQSESDPKLVATGGECTATPAPADCGDFASARSDSRQARNIAIGSFIGGGVFALAMVGALVFWPESKPAPGSARLTLSPSGHWRAPGLVLQGTF
jgi:hypothetical protein